MSSFLEEIYKTTILEHSRHPRNKGRVDPLDGEARGYNPLCGDDIRVSARLDDKGHLEAVAFDGKGCAISQSSASLMTEAVRGKSPEEIRQLRESFLAMAKSKADQEPDEDALGDLVALAGVRKLPMRVKCATLAWRALQEALDEAIAKRQENGESQETT
jgi:nitrogen fixation NifU-like protein